MKIKQVLKTWVIFLELLKEVNSMICYEMSNVKDQQLILTRKLELIDNIDEQYKEQIKLLNQQVSSVSAFLCLEMIVPNQFFTCRDVFCILISVFCQDKGMNHNLTST